VDQTEIVLNKGSLYTFNQTDDNNTSPLLIDTIDSPSGITFDYYMNDGSQSSSVAKDVYENTTSFASATERKIVITVDSTFDTDDTVINYKLTTSSTEYDGSMSVKNQEIQFSNKANNLANAVHSGTTSQFTVSSDTPVGSGAMVFDSTNEDVLTIDSQTVSPNNMSISTWLKYPGTAESETIVSNPVVYQPNSFTFGINDDGKMEFVIM
jgi:hypothetical protein